MEIRGYHLISGIGLKQLTKHMIFIFKRGHTLVWTADMAYYGNVIYPIPETIHTGDPEQQPCGVCDDPNARYLMGKHVMSWICRSCENKRWRRKMNLS